MGIGLAILIIVAILAVIISFLKDKREISEIAFKEWFYLIASLYIFIFIIPFFGGIVTARNLKADKIYVRFDDDNILNSTDSTTLTYIGKTSDYFFITNSKTKTTTAYSMDKVKSFEVITEKK